MDHFRPDEQHRLGAEKETSLVELRNLLVYYSTLLAYLLSILVSVERATRVLWKVKFSNIHY